ncbi:hypothetical protein ACMBCM_06865, partial [Spiroplasma sp. K1]
SWQGKKGENICSIPTAILTNYPSFHATNLVTKYLIIIIIIIIIFYYIIIKVWRDQDNFFQLLSLYNLKIFNFILI